MDKKEKFLELVEKGLHYDELSDYFGVTPRTIKAWSDNYGVKVKRKTNRKIFFDFDFFKTIDSEAKAYILGFVAADGYIDMKGKTLNITLAKKDEEMLKIIARELKFTGNIRKEVRERVTISFCCKEMVEDLSVYGVVQNKTKTVFIPELEEDLTRHFLRGYFDGDGYIGDHQAVLVTSSEKFDKQLLEYIKKNKLGTPNIKKATENSNRIDFYRRDQEFLMHLYEDSNIYLPRKKEAYDKKWGPYRKRKEARDKEL